MSKLFPDESFVDPGKGYALSGLNHVGKVAAGLGKPPVTKNKKNQADGEVALVFGWLMGIVVVLAPDNQRIYRGFSSN